ncbi:unnamed protein product, partial [Rotaria sp. Silwood2]
WSFLCIIITLVLLKYVIGNVKKGCYHLNSWYFVHQLWLRQLIVHSFGYSFKLLDDYHYFYPKILQWLGVTIEDRTEIKIAEIYFFLKYPSNLLKINHNLTIVGKVLLVPFNLTIVNEEEKAQVRMAMKSKSLFRLILQAFIEKFLIIYLYFCCTSTTLSILLTFINYIIFMFAYSILICLLQHKIIDEHIQQFDLLNNIKINLIRSYSIIVGQFLEYTQFYIVLLNYLGCKIGKNVIITDYHLLYDFKYTTIENNCRIHFGYVQVRT